MRISEHLSTRLRVAITSALKSRTNLYGMVSTVRRSVSRSAMSAGDPVERVRPPLPRVLKRWVKTITNVTKWSLNDWCTVVTRKTRINDSCNTLDIERLKTKFYWTAAVGTAQDVVFETLPSVYYGVPIRQITTHGLSALCKFCISVLGVFK